MRHLSWLAVLLVVILALLATRANAQDCEKYKAGYEKQQDEINHLWGEIVDQKQLINDKQSTIDDLTLENSTLDKKLSDKKSCPVMLPPANAGSKKMHAWMPVGAGGFNLGGSQNGYVGHINLGVSIMGYGRNRNDLDFRFMQFGVDVSPRFDAIGVNIIPIMYRPMPEMAPNTSFGPGIGYGTKGLNGFMNGSIKF